MDATTYRDRRRQLREAVPGGEVLLLGNLPISRSYADAHLPFRQDSSFSTSPESPRWVWH